MSGKASSLGVVLTGGGARGAYQAGVLLGIADMLPNGTSPFKIVVGQSAGAINAAALASRSDNFQEAARHLCDAWSGLTVSDVLRTDTSAMAFCALRWMMTAASAGWLFGNPQSILDNSPLRKTLSRHIDFDGIRRSINGNHLQALGITASAYASEAAEAVTFFTAQADQQPWHRARRKSVREAISVEHVMASSALPFLFPAERLGSVYYGDGALRLTSPLSPAIRLGARRILVIASRDPLPDKQLAPFAVRYPSLGELVSNLLDIVFNDHLDTDIERAERINTTLGLLDLGKKQSAALEPVSILTIRPSESLAELGAEFGRFLPWTFKAMLAGMGGRNRAGLLHSYLNFDGRYCRQLIEVGRRDAEACAGEICAFLQEASPDDRPAIESKRPFT